MIVPFMVYLISSIAETNRLPFDLPEAESELVAGFMTEYSGFRWALFFLAEYGNIVVVSSVAVTLFWGGWLRPFPSVGFLEIPLGFVFPILLFGLSAFSCFYLQTRSATSFRRWFLIVVGLCLLLMALLFAPPAVNRAIIGPFWFFLKVGCLVYLVIWIRGTFPRFRYDQLMGIGWKYMIPIGMGAILVNSVVGMLRAG
jgi:NADH-quinone oxidoreductase subunit H